MDDLGKGATLISKTNARSGGAFPKEVWESSTDVHPFVPEWREKDRNPGTDGPFSGKIAAAS